MRIQGPHGTAVAASPSAARRTAGGTFSLPGQASGPGPAATAGLHAVGGLDALMALQAFDDPTERRRRSVKHGRHALDMLESLKLSLLDGTLEPATLMRLKSLSGGLREPSGDPGLDAIMAEIELRVEVELAKAGIR
jgi:hypothetical protein